MTQTQIRRIEESDGSHSIMEVGRTKGGLVFQLAVKLQYQHPEILETAIEDMDRATRMPVLKRDGAGNPILDF